MQIHDWRRIYGQVGGAYAQFEASDQDTNSASYQYFGYETSNGAWIIQRFDLTVSGVINYRYSGGQTHAGYLVAWANRAALTYEYFSEVTIP
jgi:hypothetical protein